MCARAIIIIFSTMKRLFGRFDTLKHSPKLFPNGNVCILWSSELGISKQLASPPKREIGAPEQRTGMKIGIYIRNLLEYTLKP